jgi:hypothetical protein
MKATLKPNHWIVLVSFAIFVLSPYLPQVLLTVTVGNRVGSLLVLVAVLLALRRNALVALATFLAAAALFLENRRRTVARVRQALGAGVGAPIEELSKPARDLVPGEVHPPREEPTNEEYDYGPGEEHDGAKAFESSAAEDEKGPLETVPSNNSSGVVEFLQSRGLAGSNS